MLLIQYTLINRGVGSKRNKLNDNNPYHIKQSTKNDMNEFMTSVFGEIFMGTAFLAFAWFFLIGYALFALYEIDERDKKAMVTPI